MIRGGIAIGLAIALAAPVHAGPGSVVRVEEHDINIPPSRGPSTAPVTIEMFFSPAKSSKQAYLRVEKLQAEHPSRIRLLYRVIGSRERLPSAVLEAHAEGLFFELMEVLNDPTASLPSPMPDDRIIELGRRAGVDPARIADAIKREPFDDVIAANQQREAQRVRDPSQSPNFQVLFNGDPKSFRDDAGLERAYVEAYAQATDLLDRGVAPEALFDTLDAEAAVRDVPYRPVEPDWADTDSPDSPEETLASPPLDLHGLASYGSADAALTIAVLCDPGKNNCALARNAAQSVADNAPRRVRVVWQPFFDPGDLHTAEVGLLGDAALCAEQLGTNSDDASGSESAGWTWLKAVAAETSQRSRHVSGEAMIDRIAQRLGIDGRKLAACRALVAGTTVARIEAARTAGVHTSPATVVGGRVYPPIIDAPALEALVERELAPGVLDLAAPWTRPARRQP